MPVDRRIARRFVNASQRTEGGELKSFRRPFRVWMGSGNRRHPCSRCRKLRHLCPLGLSAPDLLFAYPYERARIPVHFRREDITLWRRCCRSQYVKTLPVTSAFILAGSCCSRHVGAYGHAISATHPDPGTIVNRKPRNFTIAVTRFRPRPRPDVCLTLSDR